MNLSAPTPARRQHPFLTHDMILEIPESIRVTLENTQTPARRVASRARGRGRVYLTGCGTALFAAMLGGQVWRLANRDARSYALPAFELWKYGHHLDATCMVLGVSHSGVTESTVEALRRSRAAGAFVVGVTHFPNRPIADVSNEVVIAGNGPDQSKCHTKCYISAAAACIQIALELPDAGGPLPETLTSIMEEIQELPRLASLVIRSVESQCRELAQEHLSRERYYYAGAGPNYPTALEAALKIEETSFLPAQGFQLEEIFHGPWVSFDSSSLVTVIAPPGPGYERAVDLVKAAKMVGASTLALVTEGDTLASSQSNNAIELPEVNEWLSPLVYIIPLYLLAYYASIGRGVNPDELRYLTPAYWEARRVVFPPGTH